MEVDSNYRIEFDVGFVDTLISPPINITFFRTSSCDNLPFGFGNQDLGAGEHLLTLTSSQNCDSLVLLNLAYYNLYSPNVFLPNFDGINDSFTILSEVGLIKKVELIIFDRWGGQIYKGAEWDGRHQGKMVNPGIFFT